MAVVALLILVYVHPSALRAQLEQAPPGLTIHVVQRGENLFRISLRYGTTVEALAQLNSLIDPTSIQVGQRLLVPDTAGALPSTAGQHTVQAGETLASIAALYALDPAALTSANSLPADDLLFVGQILLLPIGATPPPPAAVPMDTGLAPVGDGGVFHIVLSGETVYQIAQQYGVSVADITSANSIGDPSLIYPGQQLLIPGVEPPRLALDLPLSVTGIRVQPQVWVGGRTGMLRIDTTAAAQIDGSFLGMPFVISQEPGQNAYVGLIGLPIDTQPGIYPMTLTVTADGQPAPVTVNIQVLPGTFRTEALNIPEDRLALIQAEVDTAEAEQIRQIMSGYSPRREYAGPMGLPAAAAITSPFGSTRSYNGGALRRLHLGTDFAGAPGAPIFAPAAGTVVFAGGLAVRGNATIIDHGWGVFTGYWHQTEIYVSVGAHVTAGQTIGTIGSSGRVTGPHLHWELWVSGTPVDPMQWVEQAFD
jgi:murein DD-endopeptidase MepM/ murein hydrolase activator NlpD